MTEHVLIEKRDGILTITLNRPEKINAMTVEMDIGIVRGIQEAEADHSIRAIVLRGEGRCFSSGHDIPETGRIIRDLGEAGHDWKNVYARVWPEGSPMKAVVKANKPIICAIHGQVVGVMVNVVLNCDIVIAAPDTVFNSEVIRSGGGAGLSPYIGLIPHKLINELAFVGRIKGEQLLACGSINRIVPQEELFDEARRMAVAATALLPHSASAYKQGVRDMLMAQGIGDPEALERGGILSHGASDDNDFWMMAADGDVKGALHWRNQTTMMNNAKA